MSEGQSEAPVILVLTRSRFCINSQTSCYFIKWRPDVDGTVNRTATFYKQMSEEIRQKCVIYIFMSVTYGGRLVISVALQ